MTPPRGTLKNAVTPYVEQEIERWGCTVPREKKCKESKKGGLLGRGKCENVDEIQ